MIVKKCINTKIFCILLSLTHIWKGPHMQTGDCHQAELYCICIKMKDRRRRMYTFIYISKKGDYFSCSGNTRYQQRNQLCIKLPLSPLNKAGPKRDRMELVEYYNQNLTQHFQAVFFHNRIPMTKMHKDYATLGKQIVFRNYPVDKIGFHAN